MTNLLSTQMARVLWLPLLLVLSGCNEDTTAPVPSTSAIGLAAGTSPGSEIDVDWQAATDDVTAAASLEYKLLYTATDPSSWTRADWESNATTANDFTANLLSATVSGLSGGTTYYFAVVVRDAAGNKGLYDYQSRNTACFLPHTLISMADGSRRRIEDILEGDEVMSFDAEGNMATSVVGKVFRHEVAEYLRVITDDGSVDTTANHPFLTSENLFKAVGEIALGQQIFMQGSEGLIATVLREKTRVVSPTPVYNLHMVEGPPTYFADGFAVHNK